MNERITNLYRKVSVFAPWLTIALLVGMSRALPTHVVMDEQAQARKAEIASTMDDVPFIIGGWIGEDAPVPPEAQKLLRPNAMLSRTYSQPGHGRVHVLVVHCGDARDMIGHYPPVCYPSAGWVRMPVTDHEFTELEVLGERLPVHQYQFRRMRENGAEDRIRIFNAFVLPDGTGTRDIDDINRQSERLAVSVQGVAQLQVIVNATVSYEEAAASAGELLSGMPDLMHSLGMGQGADSDR